MLNRNLLGALGALLLALAGCAPIAINTDPDTFPVLPAAASQVRGPQSISLVNAYKVETKVTIFPRGATWTADLKQYTDHAITMLDRALAGRDVKSGSPAGKTVTLKVVEVQAAPGAWTIGSSVVLEAVYGDGTRSLVRAQNSSPANAHRAVSGSLTFTVNQLLADSAFLAYVNK